MTAVVEPAARLLRVHHVDAFGVGLVGLGGIPVDVTGGRAVAPPMQRRFQLVKPDPDAVF